MILAKRKILVDLAVGLLAVGLLILVKIFLVEGSYFNHWSNARGYEVLHKVISPFNPEKELSVIVLDTSDLKREPDGTTPTSSLQEIVKALVDSKAKAIAIDIDFSPRTDSQTLYAGPRADGDANFFTFLHEQKRNGVPVFVGAYNIGPEPMTWLGLEENKDLAVDMIIFDEDTTRLPRWLKCGETAKLNSISMALAEASGHKINAKPFLTPFLEDPEAEKNIGSESLQDMGGKTISCTRAFTFVNYAKLELIQRLGVPAVDRASILLAIDADGINKFQDKLVIVGDGQRGKASDTFVVSGRDKPVAGIYLNAAATYSLVDEPVFTLKHWVVVVIDIVLGLFLVLGLLRVRWQHLKNPNISLGLREGMVILLLAGVTVVIACALVRFFQVLWLDVSLIIVALLLHSQVQEALLWMPKKLFGRRNLNAPQTE